MFGQNPDEAFHRTKLGAVNHHGALPGTIRGGVLQVKTLGLVEVVLHGRHLPGASQRILDLHRYLRAIEGGTARIGNQVQTGGRTSIGQHSRGSLPVLVRTDELVFVLAFVASRELQIKVIQAKGLQDGQEELDLHRDFSLGLFGGAIGVGIVLGKTTHPSQAVHYPGFLVAIVVTQFIKPQR